MTRLLAISTKKGLKCFDKFSFIILKLQEVTSSSLQRKLGKCSSLYRAMNYTVMYSEISNLKRAIRHYIHYKNLNTNFIIPNIIIVIKVKIEKLKSKHITQNLQLNFIPGGII